MSTINIALKKKSAMVPMYSLYNFKLYFKIRNLPIARCSIKINAPSWAETIVTQPVRLFLPS